MYILESYSCILAFHLLKVSFLRCKTLTHMGNKTKVTLYMKIGRSYFFFPLLEHSLHERKRLSCIPANRNCTSSLHFPLPPPFFPSFLNFWK